MRCVAGGHPPACGADVHRGTITGSGYQINPKYLGFGTCSYIGIRLEKGSMYNAVVQELMKIPEVVECHFTTGPYTMLIKLYSRENEHLKDLLNNRIQEIPGVNSTDTMISLEQSIQRNIPISIANDEDDDEELSQNGMALTDETDE